jgi:hypothetical protein
VAACFDADLPKPDTISAEIRPAHGSQTLIVKKLCRRSSFFTTRDPKWQVATSGLHRGALKLEIPPAELGDLREFDVRVLLRSNSGVEHGSKACATLRSLTVNGK